MNALEILKSKDLKKTVQRVMLINILQNKGISLTENDIKNEMGDMYDRITFYRTIQILLDANIIHRITVDNIAVKYALNEQNSTNKCENHAHFFCKKCHVVVCLGNVVIKDYKLPANYKKEECEILIKGICSKCIMG